MLANFWDEISWRGRVHQATPEVEKHLAEAPRTGYIGADPTGPSLHVGHLATLTMLVHFQRAGHTPILLVGGATGMVGDPSGKSKERNLLTLDVIAANVASLKQQMAQFLAFGDVPNPAQLVNNYDWFKGISFLDFLRDTGKHFTVNYMLAKDSVKSRIDTGISFTEFSYQLLQAYDFLHLQQAYGCTLQMGASDQWGNITAGTELIRRMNGGPAHGITFPLVTRPDGTKFGKSADGDTISLSAEITSPYRFYQFWLNQGDEQLPDMLKTYSLQDRATVESLITESAAKPGARIGQRALAEELTVRIHGQAALEGVLYASRVLFGKATPEDLRALPAQTFADLAGEMPTVGLPLAQFQAGVGVLDLAAGEDRLVPSNSEARRLVRDGGLRLNKALVADAAYTVTPEDLLHGKYLLLQSGKKNFLLVQAT